MTHKLTYDIKSFGRTDDEIERLVENIASICDSVEFLRGVPVALPSTTKALLMGMVRGSIKKYAEYTLVKFIDSEIERLEKLEKKIWVPTPLPFGKENVLDVETVRIILENFRDRTDNTEPLAYNRAIWDEIKHFYDIKKQLE